MVLQIIAYFEGVTVRLSVCFFHFLQYSENTSNTSSHWSTYRKRGETGDQNYEVDPSCSISPIPFTFSQPNAVPGIPSSITLQYDFHLGLSNAVPLKEA